jgi:hypothetical protein
VRIVFFVGLAGSRSGVLVGMYIGLGALVVILLIVLIIYFVRRA